ncbi:class I SAM-dependent methyltransferase [uncultured Erythrobacter sp.]|uniref:class I SAM-dependent methyltransferase n=1 Tax=uncultured Erythrobacter sp. TaxID=263913 RepID=UPI00261ECFEC|nr:class I SAM-dependent methyltransferase [uncultured Erythrobacter sp.]
MGQFITPNQDIETSETPHEALNLPIYSGYKSAPHADQFVGQFRIFDAIVEQASSFDVPYEDQCSIDYYFDIIRTLRDLNGEYDRVVEVGVFMGGASVMLAGCSGRFDFDLDLIDIDAGYLQFSYERVRRTFPEATGRVRLYQGEVADYVRDVMLPDNSGDRSIIHHDGAHDFNQVVRDLSALSFVREKLHSIIAQDTHLRGNLDHMNFVDMALCAVFGTALTFVPIGKVYGEHDSCTHPNRYQGNYFRPGIAEGMVVPMGANAFQFPHSSAKFEEMFAAQGTKPMALSNVA